VVEEHADDLDSLFKSGRLTRSPAMKFETARTRGSTALLASITFSTLLLHCITFPLATGAAVALSSYLTAAARAHEAAAQDRRCT
jgi:hypothetical protein